MRYELVEIDPATGEEDQLLSPKPGTYAQMKAQMDRIMADMEEEWDAGQTGWSSLRIQPAS